MPEQQPKQVALTAHEKQRAIDAAILDGTATPHPPRAKATSEPAWEGAGKGPRSARYQFSDDGPNAALLGDMRQLRAFARQQDRNNPYAKRAADSLVHNLVGDGIWPVPDHDKDKIARLQTEIWEEWIWDSSIEGRGQDYYGLQALAVRAWLVTGEVFERFRTRANDPNLFVPLQVEMIEADRVPDTKTIRSKDGGSIIGGIEMGARGRREFYHILPDHPYETLTQFGLGVDLISNARKVPAADVMHIFEPSRPGQVRGEPRLSAALIALEQYQRYYDATNQKAMLAAALAGFITPTFDESGPRIGDNPESKEETQPLTWEPGTIQTLGYGEEIKFTDPVDVSQTFEAFSRVSMRRVAAGGGLSYEQLTGDYSETNFSAARAALIEFRRGATRHQKQVLVALMVRPTWRRLMDTAFLSGALGVPDYAKRRREYLRARYRFPKWEWVDPLKETQADIKEIEAELSSRSEKIRERGRDPERVRREIEKENKVDGASSQRQAAPPPERTQAWLTGETIEERTPEARPC